MTRLRSIPLALAVALCAATPWPAAPETLRDALVRTYKTNPTLTAARASLRAKDSLVDVARGGGRPSVSGTAGLNQSFNGIGTLNDNGRSLTLGADLSVPLFSGGQVKNSVRGAKSRVMAGRNDLRATEGDVFSETVAAYMDVILARAVVTLNRNQVSVLQTNLEATRDRFQIGDLTRTDVAQSEARLSLARAALETAIGNQSSAEETYLELTGAMPGDLQSPPPLPALPSTANQAADIALLENARLRSAIEAARAAGYDVRVVMGARLPTVSAVAGASYNNYLGTLDEAIGTPGANVDQIQTSSRIGLTARIPLYQGGVAGSRIREFRELEQAAREQVVATERAVIANARSTFARYRAALETVDSNQNAIAANELALEGTRAENSVGSRSILDVLDAEQELLNSRINLATARRNAYVIGFTLLNAMGHAEMRDLGLDGGPLYDPVAQYDAVNPNWSDWADGKARPTEATHTYGPQAAPGGN